jgi:5-methylcytosine-specific restriction endonuclease McrA
VNTEENETEIKEMKSLLLNADYTPLQFVTNIRAFLLVLKGRAEVIDMGGKLSVWDSTIRTSSSQIHLPATIRLIKRVQNRWKSPRFRKTALYARDNWSCQYCGVDLGKHLATIDHVLPRSRGGETSWNNCVASCKYCNRKKSNKTPVEAGMPLLRPASTPKPYQIWEGNRNAQWHEDWSSFLKRET